jgi:hypothetical protein
VASFAPPHIASLMGRTRFWGVHGTSCDGPGPPHPAGHEFTSQLYSMKRVSDRVYVQPPYSGRGKRNVSNLWNEI